MMARTWDKPRFGFRRSDRPQSMPPQVTNLPSSNTMMLDTPPALPPLEVLVQKNSFANLLDQLGKLELGDSVRDKAQVPLAAIPASEARPSTSLSKASHEDDTVSLETSAPVSSLHLPADKDKPTMRPGNSPPEHRDSSTSSDSRSDQSDNLGSQSSAQSSTTSVSSTEDHTKLDEVSRPGVAATTLERPARPELDATSIPRHISSDTAPRRTNPDSTSNHPVDTDKPLPPEPLRSSHKGKEVVREVRSSSSGTTQPPPTAYEIDDSARHSVLDEPAGKIPLPTRTPTLPRKSEYRENPYKIAPLDVAPVRYKSIHERSSDLADKTVRADNTERVILRIMRNLNSLSDLKAAAMVNRDFYSAFQRYETDLVSRVLLNSSLPAWELRQLIQREQRRNPFRIKSVQRDLAALDALKAFILMKCEKLCRRTTLEGLLGKNPARAKDIEDALWRIWIFCKLFGKGTSRDSSTQAQIAWLEGKSGGERSGRRRSHISNIRKGVSMHEVEDMSEMWRCMEALLSGFRGREREARKAGIFEHCTIDERSNKTEADYLEDWVYDILSVGPKAVLTLISCSFEHAKVLGVTKWTPPRNGKGRRSFLKAALEQVYRERLVTDARIQAEEFSKSMQQESPRESPSSSLSSTSLIPVRTTSQRSSHRLSRKISVIEEVAPSDQKARRPKSEPQIPAPRNRGFELADTEIRPARHSQSSAVPGKRTSATSLLNSSAATKRTSLSSLVTTSTAAKRASVSSLLMSATTDKRASVTSLSSNDPASYSHIAMTPKASTRFGATLFPVAPSYNQERQERQDSLDTMEQIDENESIDSLDLDLEPKVVDPTDRAISLLTRKLGFSRDDAKQALAMSDNGSGINVNRAVDILAQAPPLEQNDFQATELAGNLSSPPPPSTTPPQTQDYCEGSCRRPSLTRRDTSKRRLFLGRSSSSKRGNLPTLKTSNTEPSDVQPQPPQPVNDSPVSVMTVAQARTTNPRDGIPSLADFIKFRQTLRPQLSVNSQRSSAKNNRKSLGSGTVESIPEVPSQTMSPISPMTTTADSSRKSSNDSNVSNRTWSPNNNNNTDRPVSTLGRSTVTLTRVGTIRRPITNRMSLSRNTLRREQMPEIIGYTFSSSAARA